MDTIKAYLETMFSALPKTDESARLKNELLISMEEKYNELKAAGKSENEAVGKVISEFGNIDELAEEMGLKSPKDENKTPVVELSAAQQFLSDAKNTADMTALGVCAILLGTAALVFGILHGFAVNSWEAFEPFFLYLGAPLFVILVAAGVGMLIPAWLKFMKYEVFRKGFTLPEHVRQYVNTCKNDYISTFVKLIVVGVVIIVISTPLIIIPAIANTDALGIGISLYLALTGVGVIPLIMGGIMYMAYQILLIPGYYQREFGDGDGIYIGPHGIHVGNEIHIDENGIRIGAYISKSARLVGVISAIFWPLAIAVYLLWSFLSGDWHITWIMWPIAALLFGAVSGGIGAYYSLGGNKED